MSGGREHPRLAVAAGVRIVLSGGAVFETRTQNLSCAGFQMRGPSGVVAALFPAGLQPPPRARVLTRVTLLAEGAGAPVPVEVCCAAVFARRIAENEFQIGFQFQDLPAQALEWVQARIATGLRQAGTATQG